MSVLYHMSAVRFQREENSPWEPGILFNDGAIIIDQYGANPAKIWDYKIEHEKLSLDLSHIFKEPVKAEYGGIIGAGTLSIHQSSVDIKPPLVTGNLSVIIGELLQEANISKQALMEKVEQMGKIGKGIDNC